MINTYFFNFIPYSDLRLGAQFQTVSTDFKKVNNS